MKKVFISIFAIVLFFVSCYEVNEEITISENGSGTYVTRMDMSALIQMIQTMAGEEELSKSGFDRAIDTVIKMKDVMDTIQNLTDEERRLYADGSVKLQLNMKENIFKTNVDLPFRSFDDLQKLMMGAGSNSMGAAMKKIFSPKDSTQAATPAQDQAFEQINSVYDVKVNRHVLSRQLNKEKFDALMERPEMVQVKQMNNGTFEVLYTTTIKLPSKVKKVSNAELVKVSDDKRTVTIRYDMMKMFDTPEKFSYSIEY